MFGYVCELDFCEVSVVYYIRLIYIYVYIYCFLRGWKDVNIGFEGGKSVNIIF